MRSVLRSGQRYRLQFVGPAGAHGLADRFKRLGHGVAPAIRAGIGEGAPYPRLDTWYRRGGVQTPDSLLMAQDKPIAFVALASNHGSFAGPHYRILRPLPFGRKGAGLVFESIQTLFNSAASDHQGIHFNGNSINPFFEFDRVSAVDLVAKIVDILLQAIKTGFDVLEIVTHFTAPLLLLADIGLRQYAVQPLRQGCCA